MQAASEDRENALLAAREEAARQLQAAQEAAAAAAAQLADAQAAAKADVERLTGDKTELDKQLKVAQVRQECRFNVSGDNYCRSWRGHSAVRLCWCGNLQLQLTANEFPGHL